MTTKQQTDALGALLEPYSRRVEAQLEAGAVEAGCPAELAEAIRYSVLGGGKRLRPALVYMAAEACSPAVRRSGLVVPPSGGLPDALTGALRTSDLTDRAAVAVELVHCYSLVHDDLPAMDDDVLRRGRPTVHVKFGEAMAILAGDALLTRAFAVLVEAPSPYSLPSRERGAELVAELAVAAGQAGMIAGQVADMDLCRTPGGLDGLKYIHTRKTGAVIRAAARMGAISAGASSEALAALTAYAENIGLAFQVYDDVLDVTGSAAGLGKTPGKDAAAGKRTYVSQLGLDPSRALAARLTQAAITALEPLGQNGRYLIELARLLAERTH